jgi:hypothetical protein
MILPSPRRRCERLLVYVSDHLEVTTATHLGCEEYVHSGRQRHPSHQMTEYEIYLPVTNNDGTPVDADEIQRVKDLLADTFGGYTHLQHRNDGAWSIGGVTFHDEVTILRVLDDGRAQFDMPALKKTLEARLKQESVLIVKREVDLVR